MDTNLIFTLGGIGLCGLGLFGFIYHCHLLRRLIAFNLIGNGTFLIMVGFAQRGQGVTDHVIQALVLTGIVVAVSATALALVLIRRWFHLKGSTQLPEDDAS